MKPYGRPDHPIHRVLLFVPSLGHLKSQSRKIDPHPICDSKCYSGILPGSLWWIHADHPPTTAIGRSDIKYLSIPLALQKLCIRRRISKTTGSVSLYVYIYHWSSTASGEIHSNNLINIHQPLSSSYSPASIQTFAIVDGGLLRS